MERMFYNASAFNQDINNDDNGGKYFDDNKGRNIYRR